MKDKILKNKKVIIPVVAGVIVIIGIVAYFFTSNKNEKGEDSSSNVDSISSEISSIEDVEEDTDSSSDSTESNSKADSKVENKKPTQNTQSNKTEHTNASAPQVQTDKKPVEQSKPQPPAKQPEQPKPQQPTPAPEQPKPQPPAPAPEQPKPQPPAPAPAPQPESPKCPTCGLSLNTGDRFHCLFGGNHPAPAPEGGAAGGHGNDIIPGGAPFDQDGGNAEQSEGTLDTPVPDFD